MVTTFPDTDALQARIIEEKVAPTAEHVRDLFTTMKRYFRQFHSDCEKADQYVWNENKIPLPDAQDIPADPIHTGAAHAIVRTATEHVDVNNLSIEVPLAPRSQARAERLQKFYQGVWLSIKRPTLTTAVDHAFRYGIGVLKPMFVTEKWPDRPLLANFDSNGAYRDALGDWLEERNIAFPLDCLAVNPKNLIWDDSRLGPKWAIEFYNAPVSELSKWYPMVAARTDGQGMTEYLEYWDETWYGIMADGVWVVPPFEHGYGFMPFVLVDPGTGSNVGPPHQRYRSILAPAYDLLDARDRTATAYEAILKNYAWQTLDFVGQSISQATEARDNYSFFGMNVLPPGLEVRPSPRLTPPQELLQQLDLLDTMIEMVTFPNVVRGMRPKGISSGFGVSVLSGVGRLKFQPIVDAMGRGISQVNSAFAMLVENKVRGRITVHARSEMHSFDQTIGPDDINGYVENIVTLKAEAPEESERQSILASKLHADGIISLSTTQRRVGITNPLEEQVQMAAERLVLGMFPQQLEQAIASLGLGTQLQESVGPPTLGGETNSGQFQPGLGQVPRPGEAAIQQQRVSTRQQQERAFPSGLAGLNILGRQVSGGGGNGARLPSGGRSP
jgi:hypothetical protein